MAEAEQVIESAVLDEVRNGICAVGYLTVPLKTYLENAARPFLKVVGTGFLVRNTTVITNRHVIEGLAEAQANLGFPDDQQMLLFVALQGKQLQPTIRMVRYTCTADNPGFDFGFIEFQRRPEEHFARIRPLMCDKEYTVQVSEPIAVCGYPYGEAMLQRSGKVYRWGPVVQRGHVSAVSPFDRVTGDRIPDEVLLDVRIAGGMSGAPIFRPSDGCVIGIVHSSWEATTALGLPLTRPVLDEWLAHYDSIRGG